MIFILSRIRLKKSWCKYDLLYIGTWRWFEKPVLFEKSTVVYLLIHKKNIKLIRFELFLKACIGSWGKGCINSCSYGYYGHGCRTKCNCNDKQICDPKQGCIAVYLTDGLYNIISRQDIIRLFHCLEFTPLEYLPLYIYLVTLKRI